MPRGGGGNVSAREEVITKLHLDKLIKRINAGNGDLYYSTSVYQNALIVNYILILTPLSM